jgi:class 3 adenylate cyclase
MEIPETRYVPSGEIMIAYQVHGDGPHELLFSGSVASNIETVWTLPEAVRLFERLGRFARVVRFDRRDTGISDPIRDDLTLEAHAADALAVMDATGLERPFLLGAADGARSMAVLAATQPERVAGLIAFGPTIRGGAAESPEIAEQVAASVTSGNWPVETMDVWFPDWREDPATAERLMRYIRTSATPRQAKRLLQLSLQSDVAAVLPLVQAPTLALRPRESRFVTDEAVREFAAAIPNGTYREIAGAAMTMYALDVDVVADVIEEFITGSAPRLASNRVLATVLFTDLVDSTRHASHLGDRPWAQLLERYHGSAREEIGRHGGEIVKTLGDGVLATFSGPAQAARCAEAIEAGAGALQLRVRTGIHTGEVEMVNGDVAGMAVHLAARIMALADPNEILVSRTVRDLVVGSELSFADRGEHELKGFDEPWRVYALE